MARVRTFIAVDLGASLRKRCRAVQEKLEAAGADVSWVEEENLHVTLLFLGEVVERELANVCRTVALVAGRHNGFTLSVEGTGCFPNPRRPRVVWAGVGDGATALAKLHEALEPPLLEMGCYRREERQYTPHVTLGRVRGEEGVEQLAAALNRQSKWQGGATEVRELLVLSSELTPRGPQYTILGRAKLRRAGRQPLKSSQDEEE